MDVRTRLLAALVGLGIAASTATVVPAAAAPTNDLAARKGVVSVTLKTPAGVPATVTVRPRKRPAKDTRVVSKAARGKKLVRKVALAPGAATVVAKDLVHRGKIYRATVGRKPGSASVRVRAGRTTKVTVTYRPLKQAPSRLRPTRVDRHRVTLAWSGLGGSRVKLVRTRGTAPAASPARGTRIPVKARQATDLKVAPASSYTYALFTRVGKRWAGPLTVTVGTPAPPGATSTTTYELAPTTRVLTGSQAGSPRVVPTGVALRPSPSAAPLVVGQVVSLPRSAALRQGFLGRVAGISSDGTASLRPATLGEAFTHLTIDSTLLPAPRKLVRSRGAPRVRALDQDGNTCVDPKSDADGLEVEFEPYFDLTGGFDVDLHQSEGWFSVPIGVALDASLTASLGAAYGVDSDAEASCTIEFLEFEKPVPTSSPVPIVATFVAHVDVATSGRVAFDVADVSLSATMEFDAQVTTGKVDGDGSWEVDFDAAFPTLTASGQASADFGGSLTIGPGTTSDFVGATAGLKGTLNPMSLTADATGATPVGDEPTADWCLSLAASGNAKLGLNARAWIYKAAWEDDFDIPGLNTSWDYRRISWPLECAGEKSDIMVLDVDGEAAGLVPALEAEGFSVASLTEVEIGDGAEIDLSGYRQVWVTHGNGYFPFGQELREYVRQGGALFLAGSPHGRPLRVPANDEDDVGHQLGLVNSLLTPDREVGSAWLPHLCDDCSGEVTVPVLGNGWNKVDTLPHVGPSLTGPWEFVYRGVPEQNQLLNRPEGRSVGTIWQESDMRNGRGKLVALSGSGWLGDDRVEVNREFIGNAALYLSGFWTTEH